MRGLDAIYKEGFSYKKAGVIVTEIVPADQVQLYVFDRRDKGKDSKLMKAMDAINGAMGRDKVRYAVAGYGRDWKLQQELLSLCYTTNF